MSEDIIAQRLQTPVEVVDKAHLQIPASSTRGNRGEPQRRRSRNRAQSTSQRIIDLLRGDDRVILGHPVCPQAGPQRDPRCTVRLGPGRFRTESYRMSVTPTTSGNSKIRRHTTPRASENPQGHLIDNPGLWEPQLPLGGPKRLRNPIRRKIEHGIGREEPEPPQVGLHSGIQDGPPPRVGEANQHQQEQCAAGHSDGQVAKWELSEQQTVQCSSVQKL
jgi:hypothetical protein